jgi:hypothetical protein
MPVEFTLEVLGEEQVNRTLLRFGENAAHGQKLWEQMYKDLLMVERVQFLTEGAHGSGGWAKLKATTVASKKRQGLEPWILRATEALFHSLTEEGGEGQIREITDTFLRFGTEVPYAIYHMTGTHRMPARKPVQLTTEERIELTKMVQRFIVTGEVESIIT